MSFRNKLTFSRDLLVSFWHSGALGHKSHGHFVLLLASDQSQYRTAVNVDKLCCDWLKYLQNDEITLVRITQLL